MKLKFKGEKTKIKKKRTISHASEVENEEVSGWIVVSEKSEINGPILILNNSAMNVMLSTDPHFNLYFSQFTPPMSSVEPNQVNQVFIAKPVIDSHKILVKSCFDRYLGADRLGITDCEKEAVDMTNQWDIIQTEDGFAFYGGFGKYLSVFSPIEDPTLKDLKLRCDSESIGIKETFTLLCQAEFQRNSKKKKSEEQDQDVIDLEAETIRKFHSHTVGKLDLGQNFGLEVSDAKKKGKLHEALLDKRSKMKRDKFCW